MHFLKTLAVWAFVALASGSAASQPLAAATASTTLESAPQPASETTSQPFGQNSTSRLTLDVKINGKGPYAFLVDTGSDRSSISRELAATLALPPGPTVVVQGSAGPNSTPTALIDQLTLGDRTIEHVLAPAFAVDDLGADGMIGVDALGDRHLVFDFQQMRLTTSESRREAVDDRTFLVRGRNLYGRLILSHSEVRGVPVLILVDTGSQISVGNLALMRLLLSQARDATDTAKVLSVTGQEMAVQIANIETLEIGGVTVRNMPIGFGQLNTFKHFGLVRQPALLLGMDVLSKFRKVSIDVRRREATFSLN